MDDPTATSVASLALSNFSGRMDNLDSYTLNGAVCCVVKELDEDLLITLDLLERTSPTLSLIKYFRGVQRISDYQYTEVAEELEKLIKLDRLKRSL